MSTSLGDSFESKVEWSSSSSSPLRMAQPAFGTWPLCMAQPAFGTWPLFTSSVWVWVSVVNAATLFAAGGVSAALEVGAPPRHGTASGRMSRLQKTVSSTRMLTWSEPSGSVVRCASNVERTTVAPSGQSSSSFAFPSMQPSSLGYSIRFANALSFYPPVLSSFGLSAIPFGSLRSVSFFLFVCGSLSKSRP